MSFVAVGCVNKITLESSDWTVYASTVSFIQCLNPIAMELITLIIIIISIITIIIISLHLA